ncbi:MAG: SPOR domain-containing protein [Halioglobus sp.]
MNDILKQRLVGALILVALGVVFWPIIFVEPGDQAVAQRARIPARPDVTTTPIEAPDLAGIRTSPQLTVQEEPEPVEPAAAVTKAEPGSQTSIDKPKPVPIVSKGALERTRTEPPAKMAIDADGVPVAWILQVASVSSAEKADQLRDRLLQVDKKAYVKKIKSGGKVFYRVYIGPKFERAALETMQPNIDAEFGVTSMIARYIP